jgi:hypothetical protein
VPTVYWILAVGLFVFGMKTIAFRDELCGSGSFHRTFHPNALQSSLDDFEKTRMFGQHFEHSEACVVRRREPLNGRRFRPKESSRKLDNF